MFLVRITVRFRVLSALLALLAGLNVAVAQTKDPDTEEDSYTSAFCYGLNTNTNSGLLGGLAIKSVKRLDNELFGHKQFKYLALEIINVKHQKESPVNSGRNGARYVFGKTNYLFSIRPEYGREIILSSRNADEGISINAILAVGPSFGIIKPYMVRYQKRAGQEVTEQFDPIKHTNPDAIIGTGGLLDGIGDSKFAIGGHFKAAINFELSAFRNNTTGLEIGFIAEGFAQKVPIMAVWPGAADNNKSGFTSAYLTIFFGNRK